MSSQESLEVDITTQVGAQVYTSGFAFHQELLRYQHPENYTRFCTYNVGINIGPEYLHNLVKSFRGIVNMLVGCNPHHLENRVIQTELQRYLTLNPLLRIRTQEKQHAKFVIVHTNDGLVGWAGSLNFINPTLADIMVRLTEHQCNILITHFDYHWSLSNEILRPVQAMNATPICPPKTK